MFQNLLSRLLTFWPKILFYGLIAIGLLVALSFGKSFIKDRTTAAAPCDRHSHEQNFSFRGA